jgi:hypothetical protein
VSFSDCGLSDLWLFGGAGNLTQGRVVEPDVITYTVLIAGVTGSQNMYAGAKAMRLYWEMREVSSLEACLFGGLSSVSCWD